MYTYATGTCARNFLGIVLLAHEEYDFVNLRRRVEEHLRKGGRTELLAAAGLLGVPVVPK